MIVLSFSHAFTKKFNELNGLGTTLESDFNRRKSTAWGHIG